MLARRARVTVSHGASTAPPGGRAILVGAITVLVRWVVAEAAHVLHLRLAIHRRRPAVPVRRAVHAERVVLRVLPAVQACGRAAQAR
jgi:hypothetical protein